MQRRGESGQPAKRRRTNRPKVRKAPAARVSTANLQEKLDQRTRELDEALQQQTASSEVLGVIRRSPANAQPVFDAIVESATRLCDAIISVVHLCDGDRVRIAATKNFTPEATVRITELQQLKPPDRSHLSGRAILDRAIVHVPDVLNDPEYSRELALAGGWRAVLAVPLLHDGKALGAIGVARAEPKSFSERQIQLLKTFADQAVIAIENVRLFNEVQARTRDLSESLEQQTATSEVLKVISSSRGELELVFEAMLQNATRICDAQFGLLWRYDGELFHPGAMYGVPSAFSDFVKQRGPTPGVKGSPLERVLIAKKPIHTADELSEPIPGAAAKYGGARSLIAVPMLKDDALVGAFVIYRQEVRPFTDKQVEVLTNFAAQAVIAIENTRLLNELRERTDDLSKSLEQQTATSEVLKVISSTPGELEPVFNAMLANATRICEAKFEIER